MHSTEDIFFQLLNEKVLTCKISQNIDFNSTEYTLTPTFLFYNSITNKRTALPVIQQRTDTPNHWTTNALCVLHAIHMRYFYRNERKTSTLRAIQTAAAVAEATPTKQRQRGRERERQQQSKTELNSANQWAMTSTSQNILDLFDSNRENTSKQKMGQLHYSSAVRLHLPNRTMITTVQLRTSYPELFIYALCLAMARQLHQLRIYSVQHYLYSVPHTQWMMHVKC